MRVTLQAERQECGLACLVMIAAFHGLHLDLANIRRRFSTSLKGTNLAQLMRYAHSLNFSSRPLRLELDEIFRLKTPCILHWDLDHFVVLEKLKGQKLILLDPAFGRKVMTIAESSQHFTGVALELTPNAVFQPESLKTRIRLSYFTKHVVGLKRALANIFVLALGIEMVALLAPQVTQWVVDGALVSADHDLLLVAAMGGCLLMVTSFVLRMAQGWMGLRLSQQLAIQLSGNLFSHMLRLPWSYFEKRQLGDIAARFQSLSAIRNMLTNSAITAILDGVVTLITLTMMFLYSTTLTMIVLTALALYCTLRIVFYFPLRNASEERIALSARENSYFLETIRAILPLKLFNGTTLRLATWQNLIIDVQNRDITTQKLLLMFASLNTLIFGLEGMLLLYVGGVAVLNGALSLGMLLAFIAYKGQFTGRASKLIDLSIEIRMLSLHTERLADIALEEPEPDEAIETDLERIEPSIEFREISFRYAPNEPWVIKNLSLMVHAGDSVAIVGHSGCGKTTLFKLLLGLLTPTEGEILIGGIPTRQLGSLACRNLVGSVMQDDQLLAGSLAENICCFEPHFCQERMKEAAKLADIDKIIGSMPMGYQTLVSELGTGLSGGEKQRILLARALYRKPKILALDEATSHLDLHSEQNVTKALNEIPTTRLFIAHRRETLAFAKRLVRLDNGELVEDVCLDRTKVNV
ncbi:peptidase domain-containing ABC transporter [Pseudomonas sp. BGI-2]|uniref:peptidase domain-containing ABC transporter n=1 Tax=Pseudomonas sp. BGI-2 TaxID=2528211 RepID=UPI0010336FEF|nr:peptidase domain-containing ABC transporter [Pseudomonas sp. BGI-2]TBN47175.1 peptidase domain-containing ABC transporter [Pseudomonas sp. BGI-2]